MLEAATRFIQQKPKRAAALFLIFWLSLALAGWLGNYLSSGAIVVKTNDPTSTITIASSNARKDLKLSTGELKARLRSGQYIVTVNNRTTTNKKVVTLKARATSSYTINLSSLRAVEPILSFGAYGIVADGSEMLYANMQDRVLYQLVGVNPPTALNEQLRFSDIRWQDTHYGVGLSVDNRSLYAIRDGAITPLETPFSDAPIYYDVSKTGVLIISDGSSVYSAVSGGGFRKIYTVTTSTRIGSVAAGDGVALLRTHASSSKDRSESGSIIIDQNGSVLGTQTGQSVYAARWSPHGKRLVATNDDGTIIYNEHFEQIAHLADKNVLGLTWQNDTTVLYGVGGGLFSYSLGLSATNQLAGLTGGKGISGIYPSSDGSQIYVLSEIAGGVSGHDYAVGRVNLAAVPPQKNIQLGAFLPLDLDSCSVGYVNFQKPIITLTPYSLSSETTCQQAAQAALTKGGFGSGIDFYVNPVEISAD